MEDVLGYLFLGWLYDIVENRHGRFAAFTVTAIVAALLLAGLAALFIALVP